MRDPGRRHWRGLFECGIDRVLARLAAEVEGRQEMQRGLVALHFRRHFVGNVVDRGSVLDFLHARTRGRVRGLAVTFRTFERLER